MINIELYGFRYLAENTKTCIFIVIGKKAPTVNIDDVVVTIVPSTVQNRKGKSRPFVRVASTNAGDLEVAKIINEYMGLDVQWLHLDEFFEGKH